MSRKRQRRNNNSSEDADELFEEFHGYPSTQTEDFAEEENYRGNLAEYGTLIDLEILDEELEDELFSLSKKEQEKWLTTIDFDGGGIKVSAPKGGKQLYFIGGYQNLDLSECDWLEDDEIEKDQVVIGEVAAISYEAKKTHLIAPKKIEPWRHMFGEEDWKKKRSVRRPILIYDTLNNKISLAGGAYFTLPEGIAN